MKTLIKVMAFALCIHTIHANTLRLYHVGNSLTDDCKYWYIASILGSEGLAVGQGHHIACGQSLSYMVSRPEYNCSDPNPDYGNWLEALSSHEWDVITLQAYHGSLRVGSSAKATPASEVAATMTMIDTAISGDRNLNCRFYLYLAWPQVSTTESFHAQIEAPMGDENDPLKLSAAFLDYWHNAIVTAYPNLDIRVIPTGVVLATIDKKLIGLPVAEYINTYDLYRDQDHMNTLDGRDIAMSTMMSAIMGEPPSARSYNTSILNADMLSLTRDIIWFSLTKDPRTKLHTPPATRNLKINGQKNLEFSFLGNLETSTDLLSWTPLPSATSPFRASMDQPNQYYRAQGN